MTFLIVMLAGTSAAAAQAPAAEDPVASAPAPAEAPAPVLSPARRVMQVQLDKAPEPQQRQHSRQERKRIIERYLQQLGEPVPRGGPRPARLRSGGPDPATWAILLGSPAS